MGQNVQRDTLMHFHRRLAHLDSNTILRMAMDPALGIQLTDKKHVKCLEGAKGKQTKSKQSRKDTGKNSPLMLSNNLSALSYYVP